MNKSIKAAIVLMVCACIVAVTVIFVSRYNERESLHKAAEEDELIEEGDEHIPDSPPVKTGKYYLDGDKASSPYWIEFEAINDETGNGKATLHGDIEKFISDWEIKYEKDEAQESSSEEAKAPERDGSEKTTSHDYTYSELKENLGNELKYWSEYVFVNGNNDRSSYVHIYYSAPEDENKSLSELKYTEVVFDYISETEFGRDGKTFKLA